MLQGFASAVARRLLVAFPKEDGTDAETDPANAASPPARTRCSFAQTPGAPTPLGSSPSLSFLIASGSLQPCVRTEQQLTAVEAP